LPAQAATKSPDASPRIERHKTALSRTDFSRPIARALFDGLIMEETTVFDYGCGRGGDVERLSEMGVDVAGFDPKFAPETEPRPSRIVNLGFVVNVIEDTKERAEVLRKAWELTEGVLIVSARLLDEARGLEAKEFGDGVLTGRDTFQKFYEQGELRAWIEGVLRIEPLAAEPGVFYVFRYPPDAQLFLLTRVRRKPPAPRRSKVVFDEHEELINQLMGFFEENGRLPRAGEFPQQADLKAAVGTPREAWRIVLNVTDEERWDRLRVARYEDLLVYLALQRFRRRPKLSDLPQSLQNDIKDFFGSYKAACEQADRALFSISDQERLREAMGSSKVGKKLPQALYVHRSALPNLSTTLRVLEGCAKELLGEVDEGSIVKFDNQKPRVVYLEYPDFEVDPHPALKGAYSVDLRTLQARYADYSNRSNPPILHRKELFLSPSSPEFEKFRLLTEQEEDAGLLADSSRIGLRNQWSQLIAREGYRIEDHALIRI
jgi:DNA phosphorothioation-associated putative methyltransferase